MFETSGVIEALLWGLMGVLCFVGAYLSVLRWR
jgi:hypothetical protein